MEELWKPVKGYEGYFEISNLGRVKSVSRVVLKSGKDFNIKECIKRIYNNAQGYPCVTLCKDGRSRHKLLHRLIAEAFIPNPDNKPCVDHINTIRYDCRIENLRWVTQKENANNPLSLQHCKDNTYTKDVSQRSNMTRKKNQKYPIIKTVYMFDKEGRLLKEFFSATDAAKEVGVHRSAIERVLKGKYGFCKGFYWSYDKNDSPTKLKLQPNARAVLQYDRQGNLIKEYESLSAACEAYHSAPCNLARKINRGCPRGKYLWKFK